jgi:nucleoid DNA-binding protein
MTKRDLAIKISEETGQIQQNVLEVVQRTFDHISMFELIKLVSGHLKK